MDCNKWLMKNYDGLTECNLLFFRIFNTINSVLKSFSSNSFVQIIMDCVFMYLCVYMYLLFAHTQMQAHHVSAKVQRSKRASECASEWAWHAITLTGFSFGVPQRMLTVSQLSTLCIYHWIIYSMRECKRCSFRIICINIQFRVFPCVNECEHKCNRL